MIHRNNTKLFLLVIYGVYGHYMFLQCIQALYVFTASMFLRRIRPLYVFSIRPLYGFSIRPLFGFSILPLYVFTVYTAINMFLRCDSPYSFEERFQGREVQS